MKRAISVLLAALLSVSLLSPVYALRGPADQGPDSWAAIERIERQAGAEADLQSLAAREAAYAGSVDRMIRAVEAAPDYAEGSLIRHGDFFFWETADGSVNNRLLTDTAGMTGVNVISPTWFSLTDNEGNIRSIGKKSYVKKAHKDNLQVWGLVSDFSSDMDTSLVLASTAARRNCIGNLVSEAERLGLDGINLDFEYMEAPDGAAYSQFVREMSIACRKSGLVFSVDLACPYEWNSYIDRKEVGTVADYLINMGYDEHYVGSEAGSVASLAFEERAVRELIKMGIPERKIISGVPFYTRIWYTSWNDDGTMNINSEELSMGVVQTTLNTWGVTPVWDAETAQNYADWTLDNGVRCQIWIEDGESMARKILLIPKYNLGGTAAWVLGAQSDSIWQVISDNLNLSNEEAAARESEYAAEYADISEAVEDSTEA